MSGFRVIVGREDDGSVKVVVTGAGVDVPLDPLDVANLLLDAVELIADGSV